MTMSSIYLITMTNGRQFATGSLSAIFDQLTEKQAGCNLLMLYAAKIDEKRPYVGQRITVHKLPFYRKPQQGR